MSAGAPGLRISSVIEVQLERRLQVSAELIKTNEIGADAQESAVPLPQLETWRTQAACALPRQPSTGVANVITLYLLAFACLGSEQ